MLRTILQVSGLARSLGGLKLRLEAKAEDAVNQVKGVAIRIAIAAALAVAAIIFVILALIAGLVALYAYLEPIYGVLPALGVIGGSLVVLALVLLIAASIVGRGKSAKKASRKRPRPPASTTARMLGTANRSRLAADTRRAKHEPPMKLRTRSLRSRQSRGVVRASEGEWRRDARRSIAAAIGRPPDDGCRPGRGRRGRLGARPDDPLFRRPLALRTGTAHRIGHGRAALAERPVRSARGVLGRLVLDLRVQLRAEQDDDDRHPHPQHQTDAGAERSVGGVEIRVVLNVKENSAEPATHRTTAATLPTLSQRHLAFTRLGPKR
jgi:hypothetical protein